jgi:hypothetical protein
MSQRPDLIAIEHDDYHAEHVGHTADGKQFFLTTPFVPSSNEGGGEYIALYVFDNAGTLLEARIDELGQRATMDRAERRRLYEKRLLELGEVTYQRINVAPFALERFGTTFGLVVRQPIDKDDVWAVEMQPGNYMAFFEPWDSGIYDT